MWKQKNPFSSSGAAGRNSRYQRSTSAASGDVPEHRAAVDGVDRMQLEQEGGDDAEVAAPSPDGPEQVRVAVRARRDEAAVGQDDVGSQQVVDGQAVAARQVPQPTAEGQTADAGGRDDAARGRQAEGVGGVVDVAPRAATEHQRRAGDGIDPDAAHAREVDHDAVVTDAETGAVVTAAAHCQRADRARGRSRPRR